MKHLLKLFFFLSLLCTPNLKAELSTSYNVIQEKANVPILSPALKDRKSLKLQLNNGLQVLLISDPRAEQSSAAMVVETGSWEEPNEHPGLAHFLEHMLFLGTSAYPDEAEYHQYITQHGGQNNAFTMNDQTAYLFSVNNDALDGALHRFAYFFKEPLFNPSGVKRELNAIDQEYAKNIENDAFRIDHVIKTLTRKEHPQSRFNMGNSLSLANTTPADLKDWFSKYYSANIMKLVVYSSLPLDDIKEMVIDNFKDIPNNNRPPMNIPGPMSADSAYGQVIYIEPFQHERKLYVRWELPAKFAHMNESHPEKLVCHILGHEGKTSLLAELKRENLATGLSCGSLPESRDTQFLYVEIELTEEGLKKYGIVIERLFQTIALLQKSGVPQSIFDEAQKQELLDYQFQSQRAAYKEATYHSLRIAAEDLETYPERSELLIKYDPLATNALLQLLTPQKSQVILIAPYSETRVKLTEKEPWLGVHFALKPITRNQFAKWVQATPHQAITLPDPNPYLPTNLLVLHSAENPISTGFFLQNRGVPTPKPILDNEFGKVYYAQDNLYGVPLIDFVLTIRTPEISPAHSRSMALSELYAKCLQESLDDASYNAKLGGLKFSVKVADNGNGIKLDVHGYSDKAPQFFDTIIGNLIHPNCDEVKFNRYRDLLLRSYADKGLESPIEQSIEALRNILFKDYSTPKEKENAIKKITLKDYTDFVQRLFQTNYIEGIIYGNLSESDAQKIVKRLQQAVGTIPYPPTQHYRKEILILPENSGPYYIEDNITVQGNAALLAIEAGNATYKNRAAQQILMQALSEAFYTVLRTQQQTGYLVFSGGEELEGQTLDYFGVQSNTHDSRDLLARFEQFLEDYLREIETKQITPEKYSIIQHALAEQMAQPPRDMDSMTELLYELAFNYFGDFQRPQQRVDAFYKLNYTDFIQYAKESLGHSNKKRIGILLRGVFNDKNPFQYERVRSKSALRDEGTFRFNTNVNN
ncbi:MAG: insulinase family protein [Parachlamydiales bacterium]|jgi:insulysin